MTSARSWRACAARWAIPRSTGAATSRSCSTACARGPTARPSVTFAPAAGCNCRDRACCGHLRLPPQELHRTDAPPSARPLRRRPARRGPRARERPRRRGRVHPRRGDRRARDGAGRPRPRPRRHRRGGVRQARGRRGPRLRVAPAGRGVAAAGAARRQPRRELPAGRRRGRRRARRRRLHLGRGAVHEREARGEPAVQPAAARGGSRRQPGDRPVDQRRRLRVVHRAERRRGR